MTCKDCLHLEACCDFVPFDGTTEELSHYLDECTEQPCEHFKNKSDYAEVVRCGKCKHGEVSCYEKTVDGEEYTGCYCKLKNAVMDVEHYCSYGERK